MNISKIFEVFWTSGAKIQKDSQICSIQFKLRYMIESIDTSPMIAGQTLNLKPSSRVRIAILIGGLKIYWFVTLYSYLLLFRCHREDQNSKRFTRKKKSTSNSRNVKDSEATSPSIDGHTLNQHYLPPVRIATIIFCQVIFKFSFMRGSAFFLFMLILQLLISLFLIKYMWWSLITLHVRSILCFLEFSEFDKNSSSRLLFADWKCFLSTFFIFAYASILIYWLCRCHQFIEEFASQ